MRICNAREMARGTTTGWFAVERDGVCGGRCGALTAEGRGSREAAEEEERDGGAREVQQHARAARGALGADGEERRAAAERAGEEGDVAVVVRVGCDHLEEVRAVVFAVGADDAAEHPPQGEHAQRVGAVAAPRRRGGAAGPRCGGGGEACAGAAGGRLSHRGGLRGFVSGKEERKRRARALRRGTRGRRGND